MRSPSACEVDHAAQRAPDQALDLDGAPVVAPARGVALLAIAGRRGQHPVLGRHPAAALAGHPARHALLRGGRADHARLADGDQRRAGGGAHEARLDLDGAQLARVRDRSCAWGSSARGPSFQSATVGGSCARWCVSNMLPDAAHPERGSFVRDQVAGAARLGGLEVELHEFAPGARALARAARRAAPPLRRALDAQPQADAAPFDVVHAHFGLTAWPALAVPARVRALTVHGNDLRHPRTRLATRAVLPLIDLLAAVVARARRRTAGPPRARERAQVLPCGVDIERFRPIPRAARASGARPGRRRALPAVRRPTRRARRSATTSHARSRARVGVELLDARRRRPRRRCRCGSTRRTPCWCPPSARASGWRCSRRSPATCPCSRRPSGSTREALARRRGHALRAV